MSTLFKNCTLKSRCLPFVIILAAAMLTLAFPVVNGLLVYPAFKDILLRGVEQDTSLFARHMALELFPSEKVEGYSTLSLKELVVIEDLERDFNLLKLKYINESGVVLYSSDSSEFGQRDTLAAMGDILSSGMAHSTLTSMERPGKPSMAVVVSMVPIIKDGRFRGALEITYDVTDRQNRMDMIVIVSTVGMTILSLAFVVAIAAALRKGTAYVRLLEQTQELRSDVERIVQHDLRSPLTNMLSGTNYIQSVVTEPNQLEILEQMRMSGWRMMRMINRSLDLYKMECGTYAFQPEALDILAVARDVRTELSDLAEIKRIEVRLTHHGVEVAADDAYVIPAEKMLCHTLLANLVKNALEATPDQGMVTIDVRFDGLNHVLTVSNPGNVPEEIRANFFDKYVTSGKRTGTGLGTYSAKLITETQQGSISLDCDGQTVHVRVRFPAEPDMPEAGA